jgi:predicted nucleic acid-binding protein
VFRRPRALLRFLPDRVDDPDFIGQHDRVNDAKRVAAGQAIVPVLWRYEVSAVLAKAQKDGILTDIKASALLTTLQSLNIRLDREGADYILTDVHRLAVAHRLTSYDAAYLELAMRKKLPLATLDDELIRACNRIGHALL